VTETWLFITVITINLVTLIIFIIPSIGWRIVGPNWSGRNPHVFNELRPDHQAGWSAHSK
jgi:hypothetical protein